MSRRRTFGQRLVAAGCYAIALALSGMSLGAGAAFAGVQLVSQTASGTQANGGNRDPSTSGDGRYVVFESTATNYVTGANGIDDLVYVKDRQTGAVELVSIGNNGEIPDDDSLYPVISENGRFVLFHSGATNLISGDLNPGEDIYLRDRQNRITELVNVDSSGNQIIGSIDQLFSVSGDGRYVVFAYTDSAFGPNPEIYLRDRQLETTRRITGAPDGTPSNGYNSDPFISADGHYVVFESSANNLIDGGTTGISAAIFSYDTETGAIGLISKKLSGEKASGYVPSQSHDGRYVVYESASSSIVEGDTNNVDDIFVYDRQTGMTIRASVSSTGQQADRAASDPRISGNGQYVVFESKSTTLDPATNNPNAESSPLSDVFAHNRLTGKTRRVSVDSSGIEANGSSSEPNINFDGSVIVFDSWATNLVADDGNGKYDIFASIENVAGIGISLVPVSAQVAAGDPVQINVVLTTGSDATLGGGFDITLDSSALGFSSFAIAAPEVEDPYVKTVPSVNGSVLEGFAFGSFEGISGDSLVIGTLTFSSTGLCSGTQSMPCTDTVNVSISGNDVPYGGFYSARSFQPQNVTFTGATITLTSGNVTPPGGYVPGVVEFDGVNDWLSRATELTGNADSKTGLLSFWMKPRAASGAQYIYTNANRFYVQKTATNQIRVRATTAANQLLFDQTSWALTADVWNHVLIAWNTATGYLRFYVNDALNPHGVTVTNNFVDTTLNQAYVGADWDGTQKLNACVADFYLTFAETLDIDSDTNRRLFIDAAGKPVNLGASGAVPTGTSPLIFLSGDSTNFASNNGTGGAFTINGALTNCIDSPGNTGGSGNEPPIPDTGGPYSGVVNTAINFNGTGSTDPEGQTLSYDWDFGDGSAHGSGATPSYSYSTAGTYTATLTVTDSGGLSASASTSVTVTAPAPSTIATRSERGVVASVSNTWQTVAFAKTYTSPVIVTSPSYTKTAVPVAIRLRNVTGTSFEIQAARTDGQTGPVTPISVQYFVIEAGVYTQAADGITMEAVRFTSTVTDQNDAWTGQSRTYANSYTAPVVLGQVMTANDPKFSVFWSSGATRTDPPSATALTVGKHVGEDPTVTRANETVGYIVIEAGQYSVSGQTWLANVGIDIVEGMDNAPPYNYPLAGLTTVAGGVVSQTGMDGADGSWAVLYGTNAVSATALQLAVDEDQLNTYLPEATERAHSSEQIAYLVFGSAAAGDQPPTAANDSYSVNEDTVLTVAAPGVLTNDTDTDGPSALTVASNTAPANGNVTVNANGSITYTPNTHYAGNDSFSYTISDSVATATATVTITVNPVNDAPVITTTAVTTGAESVSYSYDVNATDVDSATLSYSLSLAPAGMSINATTGLISWTPTYTQAGTHNVTVQVSDNGTPALTASQNYTITVANTNRAPTPVNDSASGNEDTTITIATSTLLANDSDPDGDTVSIVSTTQGAHGTVTVSGGTVSYVPVADYTGSDSFSYTVQDTGGLTASATVNVTVNPVNDPPEALNGTLSVTAGNTATGQLIATDRDGDALTYTVVTNGTKGTATLTNTATGAYQYQATVGATGTDTFTFKANDGTADSNVATVTVTINAAATNAFQQGAGPDGLLAIEAEHYDANVASGTHTWSLVTPTGYAGAGAMQATPNTGTNNDTGYVTASPRLDFNVNFVKTGVHYVWVRGQGAASTDDSLHVGLDGIETSSSDRITYLTTSNWTWTRDKTNAAIATINVTTPGLHTLNVWMREDGTVVDKLVLTTNANYVPADLGPIENTRVAGGNNPPTAHAGGPYSAALNNAIEFNGGASVDPDGDALTYNWNFGDGACSPLPACNTATGATPTHAYAANGSYTVTLTVNDGTANSVPITAAATVSNPATNLLANPGFETGNKDPWIGGNGGMTTSAADIRSGGWAYRVWGNTSEWRELRQDVTVTAGTTYEFSGWMRVINKTTTASNSANYYTFQIRWYDASGVQIGAAIDFGKTFANIGYTRYAQPATAPAGATKGRLRFLAAQVDGTGYIDDLSITVIP